MVDSSQSRSLNVLQTPVLALKPAYCFNNLSVTNKSPWYLVIKFVLSCYLPRKIKLPFSRPGKAWKTPRIPRKSLKINCRKTCKSIVIFDIPISCVSKSFRGYCATFVRQTEFDGCRAKNGIFTYAPMYLYNRRGSQL